jgi:hypothetical protein
MPAIVTQARRRVTSQIYPKFVIETMNEDHDGGPNGTAVSAA